MPTQVLHPSAELEFRQYARTLGGAAARAAEEGYDVRTAVLEDVLAQLLETTHPIVAAVIGDLVGTMHETGTKYVERANPDANAFAVMDRVRTFVSSVEKPACLELAVSRIMRATRPSSSSALPDEKFTCVVVYVRSPITDEKRVVYRVEP